MMVQQWSCLNLKTIVENSLMRTHLTLIVEYFSVAFYATISQDNPVIGSGGTAMFDTMKLNIGKRCVQI